MCMPMAEREREREGRALSACDIDGRTTHRSSLKYSIGWDEEDYTTCEWLLTYYYYYCCCWKEKVSLLEASLCLLLEIHLKNRC